MGRGVLTLELAQGRLPSSSAIDHPPDIEHSSIQENHIDDDQNCVISENNILQKWVKLLQKDQTLGNPQCGCSQDKN